MVAVVNNPSSSKPVFEKNGSYGSASKDGLMWDSPVSEGLETDYHDKHRRVYATEQEELEFVVVHQNCDAREGGPLRNGGCSCRQ